MSENNNRLPGQTDGAPLSGQGEPAGQTPEEILAQVNIDEMVLPPDLIEDLLSDLGGNPASAATGQADGPAEDTAGETASGQASEDAPADGEAAPEQVSEDAPADYEAAPEQVSENAPADGEAAPEQVSENAPADGEAAPEQVSEDAPADGEAAPEQVSEDAPADGEAAPEQVSEDAPADGEAAPEQVSEDAPADGEEAALPPVSETALTVAGQNGDVTAGMTLMQRAQYHARMRRREQTRLRRENARREAAGLETAYQPMSSMDIRVTLVRLAAAALLLVLGLLLSRTPVAFPLYLAAYLITVLPVAACVAKNCTHGRYFDENMLILVASIGAFLLGHRAESSLVLILHGIGAIISDLVLHSTHRSVSRQTAFVPDKASVVNMQGEERQVAPANIRIGDYILVRSGERVPIDGVVLRGEGAVSDVVLTGDSESIQVEKNIRVLAGSLYTGSLLLMRATAKFEDCALNQIAHVQETGRERKASLEKSALHGAEKFIPIMVVVALLLAIIPPLFNSGTSMANWVYRALIILVVCCPTALAVSVPLCFLCGTGRLSQKGIHVKGSEAVEKLAELRMAVFDKTGTLTEGRLRVKEIHATKDFNQESILALAAAAEQLSPHPVGCAVVAAYQGKPQKISEFEEFAGRGVRARIGNRNLLVGNRRLMVSRGVKGVPDIRGTVVYVAYEGDYAGAIVLEDTIRPEAAEAIKGLKSLGVLRTVILTGDTESPAQQTADAIGIDTVHASLLPEEKASKMEFLMRTIPTDGTSAYIGDGINDMEELKMADVGVAMGAAGTSQTADAANVLIMTNDLTRLSDAVRISHRTHGIAMQNMVFALLVKLALVLLTALGVTYMWQAVAADVLVTVLAVLNAARIMGVK